MSVTDLLLDTHTFLWWDEGKLPKAVVRRIQRGGSVWVSAASAWEISIKAALGKIDARAPLSEAIRDYGFLPLAVSLEHGDAVRSLPHHHRDPFDRMLVAQARTEGLTLVSRDPLLRAYDVQVVWE
jgi:PIN domain nuclease of toxin-antitoxin system